MRKVFSDIKKLNELIRHFKEGELTKAELSRKYKVSRATITLQYNKLKEQGII